MAGGIPQEQKHLVSEFGPGEGCEGGCRPGGLGAVLPFVGLTRFLLWPRMGDDQDVVGLQGHVFGAVGDEVGELDRGFGLVGIIGAADEGDRVGLVLQAQAAMAWRMLILSLAGRA